MNTYHKITNIYKRDPATKFKTLLPGQFASPELAYLQNNNWVFTEKVDGTNIKVMFSEGQINFAGKTDRAEMPELLGKRLKEVFRPKLDLFIKYFEGATQVCFYGEGYGPKIQSGGKYSETHEFVLFDIKVNYWWLKRDVVEVIAEDFGIDIVPIIGNGTLHDAVDMATTGFGSQWGNFTAEGLIARPAVEFNSRGGTRIIAKAKHKDFA